MSVAGRLYLIAVAASCCATVGLAGQKATAQSEITKLTGVWSYALVEVEGEKQPEMPFETNKLIISADGGFTVVQGSRTIRGMLTLDPTQTPKHYDFAVTDGSGSGLTVFGIYELDDDGQSYRLCLPLRGQERPTAFSREPGGNCLFQVFERSQQSLQEAFAETSR